MNAFSSILNSLYIYLYGQSSNPVSSLNCPITLQDAVACGTLRRQLSNAANNGYKVLIPGGEEYVYNIDSCQTVYLVEKNATLAIGIVDKPDGHIDSYDVTILFTRETRENWLNAKLKVILQRVFLMELNIPILKSNSKWAIVGTIDCQPDRNQRNTKFHQDNILTQFLPQIDVYNFNNNQPINFKDYFSNFFTLMFPSNPPKNPEIFVPSETLFTNPGVSNEPISPFKVFSPETAHVGILDYNSEIPIIAAAARYGDDYIFTVLPKTTNAYRGFLFYLNSIITHATPEELHISIIRQWFEDPVNRPPYISDKEFYRGFNTLDDLMQALEKYNELRDDLSNHARDFRRILGKVILFNEKGQEKQTLIDHLKYTFYNYATNKLLIDLIFPPVPPARVLPGAPPGAPEPDIKKRKESKEGKDYTYMSKRFSGDEITNLRSQIEIAETLKNNEVKTLTELPIVSKPFISEMANLPFQFSLPRVAVEGSGDVDIGGSRSNRKKQRNTKKKQNKNKLRKGRRTKQRKLRKIKTKKR